MAGLREARRDTPDRVPASTAACLLAHRLHALLLVRGGGLGNDALLHVGGGGTRDQGHKSAHRVVVRRPKFRFNIQLRGEPKLAPAHLPSVSASSLAWYVDRHGAERTSARSTTWWFCLWMLERRCDVGLSLQDLTAKCARMRFPLIKDARARTTSACVRRICLPRAGGSETGICPSASDVASRTQVRQTDRQTDRILAWFWRSAWQQAWRWQQHAAPCSRISPGISLGPDPSRWQTRRLNSLKTASRQADFRSPVNWESRRELCLNSLNSLNRQHHERPTSTRQ